MEGKELASQIGREVTRHLTNRMIFVLFFVLALGWVRDYFHVGFDETDGAERSQLDIRTDCATGLQYLAGRDGGLTPRLSADGKQIVKACEVTP